MKLEKGELNPPMLQKTSKQQRNINETKNKEINRIDNP